MFRPRRTTVAEVGIVLAIVFAIQAHSCATQERIDVNGAVGGAFPAPAPRAPHRPAWSRSSGMGPLTRIVGYLHLFPDYVRQEMVWIQLGEHVVLGAVILLWISRRVRLTAPEGAPVVS